MIRVDHQVGQQKCVGIPYDDWRTDQIFFIFYYVRDASSLKKTDDLFGRLGYILHVTYGRRWSSVCAHFLE